MLNRQNQPWGTPFEALRTHSEGFKFTFFFIFPMIWFRFSFLKKMSNEIILFQILYKHLKYLFLSFMKLRIGKFILDVCHVLSMAQNFKKFHF